MAVVVVVPRDVKRMYVRQARKAATAAGYQVRRDWQPVLSDFIRLEFQVALHREERLVLEAFEIEVDDFLTSIINATPEPRSPAPFSGSGARVETS
jgi:hypothetical protein